MKKFTPIFLFLYLLNCTWANLAATVQASSQSPTAGPSLARPSGITPSTTSNCPIPQSTTPIAVFVNNKTPYLMKISPNFKNTDGSGTGILGGINVPAGYNDKVTTECNVSSLDSFSITTGIADATHPGKSISGNYLNFLYLTPNNKDGELNIQDSTTGEIKSKSFNVSYRLIPAYAPGQNIVYEFTIE